MLLQMAHSKILFSGEQLREISFCREQHFCRAFHIWPLGKMYLAVSLTFGGKIRVSWQ
jgi:hypothetical protein